MPVMQFKATEFGGHDCEDVFSHTKLVGGPNTSYNCVNSAILGTAQI